MFLISPILLQASHCHAASLWLAYLLLERPIHPYYLAYSRTRLPLDIGFVVALVESVESLIHLVHQHLEKQHYFLECLREKKEHNMLIHINYLPSVDNFGFRFGGTRGETLNRKHTTINSDTLQN